MLLVVPNYVEDNVEDIERKYAKWENFFLPTNW